MASPRLDRLGRYELVLELGRGGMAELYLAIGRNEALGWEKVLAIKRILPHLAEDPQFVEMFLNEGRIAARLGHTNICTVFEIDRSGDELYLVMEYLEGASWDVLSAAIPPGAESLRAAAGVLGQACEGLHHAHSLRDVDGRPTPVIHRDVSPQNLFVTTEGICKVLDFGVSKILKDGPRTRTGVLKGKLPYMSPEQIRGEPLDARADVFAMGVVLWESLAKASLFDRDTDFLIWKAISEDEIPPLAERGYPVAVDEVLARALARDREQRFASARLLGEAIREVAKTCGGALDAAGVAATIRARCGDRLATHEVAVADALRASRVVTDPSDTIRATPDLDEHDGGSTVSLRTQPAAIERAVEPTPPAPRTRRGIATAVALVAVVGLLGLGIAVAMRARERESPTAAPIARPPADAGSADRNPYLTPEDLDFQGSGAHLDDAR